MVTIDCEACGSKLSFELKQYDKGMLHPRFLVCATCMSSGVKGRSENALQWLACDDPDCVRCVEMKKNERGDERG